MRPRPTTARRTRAPPLKRLRKPSTPEAEAELSRLCNFSQLTPGTGTLAPIWYRAMMASVKMTLFRRTGTLKMLAGRESMALPLSEVPERGSLAIHQSIARGGRTLRKRQRHTLDATPCGGDGRLGRLGERVDRDPDWAAERSVPQDLDEGLRADQAGLDQRRHRDLVGAQRVERGQVHRCVLDPEGVLEPLQLGNALHQGELSTLEAGRQGVASLLTLGPTARRLVALPSGATADPALGRGRALGRRQIVELHLDTSSMRIRCGTRASMPLISGRSGSSLDCPMPRSPRARRVPRCFGLVPMAERVCVTSRRDSPVSFLVVAAMVSASPPQTGRSRACARGRPAGRRPA